MTCWQSWWRGDFAWSPAAKHWSLCHHLHHHHHHHHHHCEYIINTTGKIMTESRAFLWKGDEWLECTVAPGGGQPQEEDHITHQFDRKCVTANLDKYGRVALYQYKIITSLTWLCYRMKKLSQTISHPLKFRSWPRPVIIPLLTKNLNSWRIVGLPTSDEEVPPSLTSDDTAVMLVPHCRGNYVIIIYTQFINCHGFEHLGWALCKVWRELLLKEWSCCNTLTQHCFQISPWAKNEL